MGVISTRVTELKTALMDALGCCKAIEMQLRHRQVDLRCVEATENAKQAAKSIRVAMELAGDRQ